MDRHRALHDAGETELVQQPRPETTLLTVGTGLQISVQTLTTPGKPHQQKSSKDRDGDDRSSSFKLVPVESVLRNGRRVPSLAFPMFGELKLTTAKTNPRDKFIEHVVDELPTQGNDGVGLVMTPDLPSRGVEKRDIGHKDRYVLVTKGKGVAVQTDEVRAYMAITEHGLLAQARQSTRPWRLMTAEVRPKSDEAGRVFTQGGMKQSLRQPKRFRSTGEECVRGKQPVERTFVKEPYYNGDDELQPKYNKRRTCVGATQFNITRLRVAMVSDKAQKRLVGAAIAPTQLNIIVSQHPGSTCSRWNCWLKGTLWFGDNLSGVLTQECKRSCLNNLRKPCVENHILEEEMLQAVYESLQGTIGQNIKELWAIEAPRNWEEFRKMVLQEPQVDGVRYRLKEHMRRQERESEWT
ncbi:hypothetical protein F2Q69_00013115 [Brassica cretica]|uniref:Uncharacterized protein n=1 Tax=Brassica cretica TaxID=69181 RepID=A0A8S9R6I2_BRACR|nr:hypothetical protein F2Q69_00013115 [Brassica cretica]